MRRQLALRRRAVKDARLVIASFLGVSCCVLSPSLAPGSQSLGVANAFSISSACNPRQHEVGACAPRTRAANELHRRTLWIAVAQTVPGFALLPDAAEAADLAAARKQLVAGVSKVDDLLANFDAIIAGGGGGGDKVLTAFRGTDSPLNKLEQKCAQLAVVAEDPEGFQDALEAYSKAKTDADGKAYSSNFAGGSGNPNKNNPKVILRAAKESTEAMRAEMGKMLVALGSP